ncbi:GrdX family protein [Tissierella sp. Yu-01]|uniref:GrdX family protein n=1 Tax=Tissierella sp. Yu-01 TaxID=3035694 RepID=UPI00240CFA93|nr:GrdX family protein [Tissierella sp. Yu-01]WFA09170.1 GrdX family protein [Tissierella sp. Yu-01]
MKSIIITNNEKVYNKFIKIMDVVYLEESNYLDILLYVRDKIHDGHKLLTHPLSGSIKPNETPFKSIMISSTTGEFDTQGLLIIEESILTAQKFINNKPTPNWVERVLDDFRVIDLSLMENVIEKLGHI